MRCVFCGGTLKSSRATFTYEQDGKYLVVEDAPAEVCTRCGERSIPQKSPTSC